MGSPRKARRKYLKPSHPWQKERIETERRLVRDYGLKNKKEVWKANTFIKRLKDRSKLLSRVDTPQSEKETQEMLTKLTRLGILSSNAELSDVLSLETDSALERRLQTVVFKKGFARSVGQARQIIVHGHISVNGKKITFPSYYTTLEEAAAIEYTKGSAFNDAEHPERKIEEKPEPVVKETKEKKEKVAEETDEDSKETESKDNQE